MADIPKKSRRPRRQFDEDFKAQAVRLVLDERKTAGAVARDLDLTETTLRNWVKQAQADRTHGRTGLTTAERDELARLRKENRVLREEREILKKGGRLLRERAAVKFRFIAAEKASHSLMIQESVRFQLAEGAGEGDSVFHPGSIDQSNRTRMLKRLKKSRIGCGIRPRFPGRESVLPPYRRPLSWLGEKPSQRS